MPKFGIRRALRTVVARGGIGEAGKAATERRRKAENRSCARRLERTRGTCAKNNDDSGDLEEPRLAGRRIRLEAGHSMQPPTRVFVCCDTQNPFNKDTDREPLTGGESQGTGSSVNAEAYAKSMSLRRKTEDEKVQDIQDAMEEAYKEIKHRVVSAREAGRAEKTEVELQQDYAIDQIKNAYSSQDLLRRAELLIKEDWLANVDEMHGNVYRLAAFGVLQPDSPISVKNLKPYAKMVGSICIVIVQIFGPPLIVLSKTGLNLGSADDPNMWRCWPIPVNPWFDRNDTQPCYNDHVPAEVSLIDDWTHGRATTKALGFVFILMFVLNALFIVLQEQRGFTRIQAIFRYLQGNTPNFEVTGGYFLVLGAFCNNWVVLWSCLSVFMICGSAQNPQDLLMDALGLLFMYNLDDLGGDLGFLEDADWPGFRLGWIHDEVVMHDDDFDAIGGRKAGTKVVIYFYTATAALVCAFLVILPPLTIITPFMAIASSEN